MTDGMHSVIVSMYDTSKTLILYVVRRFNYLENIEKFNK